MIRSLSWLALTTALVACAGDDTKASDTAATPTFTEVRDDILLPSCGFASCHGAGAGGLQLDAATAYVNLVDVTSGAMAPEVLVVPGDAEGSYLVTKLEDSGPIAGDPMPPPLGGLDPADVQRIRDWIDAGAADD